MEGTIRGVVIVYGVIVYGVIVYGVIVYGVMWGGQGSLGAGGWNHLAARVDSL
jgi:hypothetical protein